MNIQEQKPYILGHLDEELIRLRKQAEVHAAFTEEVLRRAGLKPGMKVLDLGCGIGDVSLIAARIVGPRGCVVGLDRAAPALSLARARAEADEISWVRFDSGDFETAHAAGYDAVIGRFILMHLADPEAALLRLSGQMDKGALIAFIEMDLSTASAVPPLPLFQASLDLIAAVYRQDRIESEMGSRLYALFRKAGLAPDLLAAVKVEAGPDAYAYDYMSETLRSLLPRLEALRLANQESLDLDTLAERLRREALQGNHCFFYPRMVAAYARQSG